MFLIKKCVINTDLALQMSMNQLMQFFGTLVIFLVFFSWAFIIFLFSPNKSRLRSMEDIKFYLIDSETCKCGLKCPLKAEETFSFNPLVPSVAPVKQDPTKPGCGSCKISSAFEKLLPHFSPEEISKLLKKSKKKKKKSSSSFQDELQRKMKYQKIGWYFFYFFFLMFYFNTLSLIYTKLQDRKRSLKTSLAIEPPWKLFSSNTSVCQTQTNTIG